MRRRLQKSSILVLILCLGFSLGAAGEVVLQYFNTTWKELAEKMPELAEVGYGSLWLPPPTKGSGGLSVGYDLWDPFDLGGEDQRSTVKTRYGTEEELLRLIEVAHRFGLRVYFDNIMNHRAFDVPGFNENTPIDVYPGMVPEDFHLRVTEDGFYRKWDNVANWQDVWQVQNRNFSDLIDISQENGDGDNGNFGGTEGSTHPKIRFVRHPDNPEYYDYHPTLGRVGFFNSNITAGIIASNPTFYAEYVNGYLNRAVRWLVHHTKVDGLRLDAVKHVPSSFFGDQNPATKDASNAGYTGQAQEQFNLTRGFIDANHRDTVFNTEQPRDDLMMFGEHLGEPPGVGEYFDAGMRLVDSKLHGYLNGNLGEPWGNLDGLQYGGGQGFASGLAVPYVKSHDDDYATRPELQFALNLTREGLPNVYTDGNYQSETLAQSGGAFPRHANIAFLGQFGDNRIPNLVYVHEHFSRGYQTPRWGDGDVVAYDRLDDRENGCMDDVDPADAAVMSFMMNDDYSGGQYREIETSFPVGAYLWQYAAGGGSFYYTVPSDRKIKVIIPAGGYFAFSWRSPEASDLWAGSPVTIYENGVQAGTVTTIRKDGPDGDPGFNPYGVTDSNGSDFQYAFDIPRVTSRTNLRFAARVDGSAVDVQMKLDGGMDLNGETNALGDLRDNPPAISYDMFLGYESASFHHRQWPEKFAAVDTGTRNVIGSAGAETWEVTIGSSGIQTNEGGGYDTDDNTADWIYHSPSDTITASNQPADSHFTPAPVTAAGSNITLWVKVGFGCHVNTGFVYYTTDGQTFPEGGGGEGANPSTQAAGLHFVDGDQSDGTIDWWRATLPAMTNGTVLRYKIGMYLEQGAATCGTGWEVVFPSDANSVFRKKKLMGVWEIDQFNGATNVFEIHNDYGLVTTGLVEGFHILRARAFLQRDGIGCGNGKRASIYNTFSQTFYMDVSAPTGQIVFPASDFDTLGSQEYGAAVRTDPTAQDVWYNIQDNDPANDDGQTSVTNGNGTNAMGQVSWARASSVIPSIFITNAYPDEWRFTYRNIPSSGNATMLVKLAEMSSSTNPLDDDATGHFGTLQRIVICDAPTQAMFVAFPASDGEVVGDDYIMKIFFSKSLNDTDEDTLRSRFLVKINGSAQAQSAYSFNYDIDADHHELAFDLPDLFNGDENFLHNIEVTHVTGGGVTLEAHRFVKAAPTDRGPYVSIVSPPEVDSDGQPFVIVLPDVASPSSTQRQYVIQVETDLDAEDVWIEFDNGAGIAGLMASTESQLHTPVEVTQGTNLIVGLKTNLTGTLSLDLSNTVVNGVGTLFSNELDVGYSICIDTNVIVVTQIVSQTQLEILAPYEGASLTNVSAGRRPAFDLEISAGAQIRVDTNILDVTSVQSSSNLLVDAAYPGVSGSSLTAYLVDGNPTVAGNRKFWSFLWTNITEGFFTFHASVDTNGVTNTVEASVTRNTQVAFREIVITNTNDFDDDDDGLYDFNEVTGTNLPSSNPETWNNAEVHIWYVYGKTDPQLPDTDGDGLPDGLESGWRGAIDTNETDTSTDTNGDGFPNFISDLDPPFFNTLDNFGCVPDVTSSTEGGDRASLVRGSMTDPNNPDSDFDGIADGIEDWNRNGWVDGDGDPLGPAQDKCTRASWPTRVFDASWTETSPNDNDTDNDGATDGYGEDKDFDGLVAGDSNSNRIFDSGELWTETDPLNVDTDGDGLPDGWEVSNGLDPLNDGVLGHTNMQTGGIIATNEHGASGNPDGDFIVVGMVTNPYSNLLEFQNGTHPRIADTGDPLPEGSIIIGKGDALGLVNGMTNYQEFTEWTWDDLIVLDEYEGDGPNNQGGDLYLGWDGWDSSRDIVAFYARDGGATQNLFNFRVDFHDLQPLAEEGNLDLYVVIDTGNPLSGEMALPDDVDLHTSNRWEVVVAVYQSNNGRCYVDLVNSNNSTATGQDLASFGVETRDQNHATGFREAYFNAELDSVEFSISRQALTDAGWNGIDAKQLNYQVFTTKDGTCNGCVDGGAGAGDIGGRNDVRDSIYDDNVAEDYWQNQPSIQNALGYWFSGNDQAGRAKISVILHGNQAIKPGNTIQDLINTGSSAGYHRPLDVHEVYEKPFNLHVTPTLATALEWARADTNTSPTWRDGPLFNDRIATLVATNVIDLLVSTFSDHMLPYFTTEFSQDNLALANEFLGDMYGATFTSNSVFWTPERLLDDDVFTKIQNLGYQYTVLDQDTHLSTWLGRTTALGEGGYKINKINGVNCFVLNDGATAYRFVNHDGGLSMPLRALFNRRGRAGNQNLVVSLFSNWEDFTDNDDADAYDANVRWLANRPWTELVTLEQIASGEIDLNGDGGGELWGVEDRGNAATNKIGHNWLQHATQLDYDNWYSGSLQEESLQNKTFEIRSGTNVSQSYSMMFFPGLTTDTWDQVTAIANSNLARLARGVLHASVFQTAFHDQGNNNLQRFSTGDYVFPDTDTNNLASFSKNAQSQTRMAALLERVDDWAAIASGVTTPQVATEDVDLDGEDEYLLYNDRQFAVFERIGGRMIGAWARDIIGGNVYQALGNLVGYSNSETEEEGTYNVETNGGSVAVIAHRTSGLKDWFASKAGGTTQYNNDLYTFLDWTNGWRITSSDSEIQKTVTLDEDSWLFEVDYIMSGSMLNEALYVRHGLSPHLYDLLLRGQGTLGDEVHSNGVLMVANTNYEMAVVASVGYGDAGHTAAYSDAAVDDDPSKGVNFFTLNMRNQAQTHQVELVGTNSLAFSLGFRVMASDWDNDGLPNTYEDEFEFDPMGTDNGSVDTDGDGIPNVQEYIASTHPTNGLDFMEVGQTTEMTATGVVVRFEARPNRAYSIFYVNDELISPTWSNATTAPITVPSTNIVEWTDPGPPNTLPHPMDVTSRYYRIDVSLPQ